MLSKNLIIFACLVFTTACNNTGFDYTPKSKAGHSYRQMDGVIVFFDKNNRAEIEIKNEVKQNFKRVAHVTITTENIGNYNFIIGDCVKIWVSVDTLSKGEEWFIPLNRTIAPCKN